MTQLRVVPRDIENTPLDIEARIQIGVAVDAYVRAEREFNEASRRFNESCNQLRSVILPNLRVVIRREWRNYLLTTNTTGDFDVEEVDSI